MQAHLNEILEKAIKAPYGHNTQPWKFRTDGNVISIFTDYERALQVVDADNYQNGDKEQIMIALRPSTFKIKEKHFGNIDIRQSARMPVIYFFRKLHHIQHNIQK